MMNERIKQLAEQAGITTNLDTDYFEKDSNKWVDYYSDKFAELIVRECCQKLENDGMVEVAMEMKQHFGVEE